MTLKRFLPAEQWEDMTRINSAMRAIEQQGDTPVSVVVARHRGSIYTAFATTHGKWGHTHKPTINAYRLLLPDAYTGQTMTRYHDEGAIARGERRRGDHTGLIVKHRGELLVCAEPAELVCDLPSIRLPAFQAKAYDERERRHGWRSLLFGGEPERGIHWATFEGHPVVEYRGEARTARVLLWRYNDEIRQLWLHDDVELEDESKATAAPSPARKLPPAEQISLF